jgi:CelD/BcsL family acetyltransferase involved in cellulose biosynthesis
MSRQAVSLKSTSQGSVAGSGAADFVVDVDESVEPFLQRWAKLLDEHASPFHAVSWLRAWYATLGAGDAYRPVLVGVRRKDTGADVMLLPLTSRRSGGLSIVEFADGGIIDYISPLLAPDWAGDLRTIDQVRTRAHSLWLVLRGALRDHDVLLINKMLGELLDEHSQRVNPLMQSLRTQSCEMFGNQFHVPGDWDAWRFTLDKRVRKEMERCWRVFTRSEQARFERMTDLGEAQRVFALLEQQQGIRMHQAGARYVLDQPVFREFYRQALNGGLSDGSVVLTALRDGDHIVAALFGVANGDRFIALRLSIGGDEWKACSPGRLLCERTARHLNEQGLHWFDFGIGDYFHKETFQVTHIPLHDACEALSWRGVPMTWWWRLRRALKRQAWLVALSRRMGCYVRAARSRSSSGENKTAMAST